MKDTSQLTDVQWFEGWIWGGIFGWAAGQLKLRAIPVAFVFFIMATPIVISKLIRLRKRP